MAGPNIGRDFRAVDSSGDPAAFIAYLDDARRILEDLKDETIGALELRRGDSVLDVGCGTATTCGRWLRSWVPKGASWASM